MRGRVRAAIGLATLVGAGTVVGAGCAEADPSAPSACEGEPIEAFKELLVVEEPVITDARALNAQAGPWSFRYAIENLAPEGVDPGAFTHDWLQHWVMTKELNGFQLDTRFEERVDGMRRVVLCPWLKATPENACNADCSACSAQTLDLAKAPFRLAGIANRMDQSGVLPEIPNGEGRLIFALTDGPGDAPESKPLAMGLIFEYALPETRSAKEWADAWHALGRFPSYDEAYKAALQEVTDGFVKRGARPKGRFGSALAQIRTNDGVLNWIWQLREFQLDDHGALRLAPVFNTPAQELNNSPALRSWVIANKDAIREKKHNVPAYMRSGSADALRYSWEISGVDEATVRAFAESTCNGCHSTQSVVDTAFHVSPFRQGRDRVSELLSSRSGKPDELHVRARRMREILCSAN